MFVSIVRNAAFRVVRRTAAGGLAACLSAAPAAVASGDVVVIKAKRVLPVCAAPIENGVIVIRDGAIVAVGAGAAIPDGARVIELDGVVTPGLIDAHAAIDPQTVQAAVDRDNGFFVRLAGYVQATAAPTEMAGPNLRDAESDLPLALVGTPGDPAHSTHHDDDCHDHSHGTATCPLCGSPPAPPLAVGMGSFITTSEQASEVVPHTRVIDAYNPLSSDFDRLARSGVTTVYMSPDSTAVIGPRGAIVKTGGPLGERVVREADAVKASMGSDPCYRGAFNRTPNRFNVNFHTRRPTTRMGVDWVFRKAFYDAQRVAAGLPVSGADTPPAAAFPILSDVLAGKTPLRIQARMQHDIFSSLRLADEFKLRFILEEATEAYQCLPQLKAAGVPVVYGPIFVSPRGFRAFNGEADDPRLTAPRELRDAGVEFALTANDLRDEDGLVRQGMMAVRYGLSPDEALRAITVVPAKLMGLDDKLGVLKPGAAADLVVWSGEPFEATTRPLLVMINGQVVHEEK